MSLENKFKDVKVGDIITIRNTKGELVVTGYVQYYDSKKIRLSYNKS